jgi:hypothetical protein
MRALANCAAQCSHYLLRRDSSLNFEFSLQLLNLFLRLFELLPSFLCLRFIPSCFCLCNKSVHDMEVHYVEYLPLCHPPFEFLHASVFLLQRRCTQRRILFSSRLQFLDLNF